MRGLMQLETLQFESKMQKRIRMRPFWGGISFGIRSEITFYSAAHASP